MEKQGFIYIWRDRKHKMYYLGCHWGSINDGYICSSNRMREAYRRRPHDFKRRILKTNIDKSNIRNEEHKWLSLIHHYELGKKYYNLSKQNFKNHSGIASTIEKERERRRKIGVANSKRLKGLEPWNKNKRGYKQSRMEYEYHILDPYGKTHIENGLNTFCFERNLQANNLRKRGYAQGYTIVKKIKLKETKCTRVGEQ